LNAVDSDEVRQPERPEEAPTAEIRVADLLRIFDNLAAEFKAIADIVKSTGGLMEWIYVSGDCYDLPRMGSRKVKRALAPASA
jgi:hypothetical protein